MRIFGFVVLRAKSFEESNDCIASAFRKMLVKIGALEYDKKELQKKLKDAEIRIEQLKEMNDGLWEMKDPTMKGE